MSTNESPGSDDWRNPYGDEAMDPNSVLLQSQALRDQAKAILASTKRTPEKAKPVSKAGNSFLTTPKADIWPSTNSLIGGSPSQKLQRTRSGPVYSSLQGRIIEGGSPIASYGVPGITGGREKFAGLGGEREDEDIGLDIYGVGPGQRTPTKASHGRRSANGTPPEGTSPGNALSESGSSSSSLSWKVPSLPCMDSLENLLLESMEKKQRYQRAALGAQGNPEVEGEIESEASMPGAQGRLQRRLSFEGGAAEAGGLRRSSSGFGTQEQRLSVGGRLDKGSFDEALRGQGKNIGLMGRRDVKQGTVGEGIGSKLLGEGRGNMIAGGRSKGRSSEDEELLKLLIHRTNQLETELRGKDKLLKDNEELISKLQEDHALMRSSLAAAQKESARRQKAAAELQIRGNSPNTPRSDPLYVRRLEQQVARYRKRLEEIEDFLAQCGMVWESRTEGSGYLRSMAELAITNRRDREGDATAGAFIVLGGQEGEGVFRINFDRLLSSIAELNSIATDRDVLQGGHQVITDSREARPRPPKEIELVLYSNGIVVGEGSPFRPFTNPSARGLIEDLVDGYLPHELKSRNPEGAPIRLVDRHQETYQPPFAAFSGRGKLLGRDDPAAQGTPPGPGGHGDAAAAAAAPGGRPAAVGSRGHVATLEGLSSGAPDTLPGDPITREEFLARLPPIVIRDGTIIPVRTEIAAMLGGSDTSKASGSQDQPGWASQGGPTPTSDFSQPPSYACTPHGSSVPSTVPSTPTSTSSSAVVPPRRRPTSPTKSREPTPKPAEETQEGASGKVAADSYPRPSDSPAKAATAHPVPQASGPLIRGAEAAPDVEKPAPSSPRPAGARLTGGRSRALARMRSLPGSLKAVEEGKEEGSSGGGEREGGHSLRRGEGLGGSGPPDMSEEKEEEGGEAAKAVVGGSKSEPEDIELKIRHEDGKGNFMLTIRKDALVGHLRRIIDRARRSESFLKRISTGYEICTTFPSQVLDDDKAILSDIGITSRTVLTLRENVNRNESM